MAKKKTNFYENYQNIGYKQSKFYFSNERLFNSMMVNL